MQKLKPCPFCGSDARIIPSGVAYSSCGFIKRYQVECSKCDAKLERTFKSEFYIEDDTGELVYEHNGRTEAIEAWNRRVDE